ncbi:hypothetical protein F7R05_19910 [Pseudomonas koreensis]|nr:hypothetical protein F7R05_19910 [Pseudomonas koreensis]
MPVKGSVARELAPAGLRSKPFYLKERAATRPGGSKLPRHKVRCRPLVRRTNRRHRRTMSCRRCSRCR